MPSLTSLLVRRFLSLISAGLLLSTASYLLAQEQAKPTIELGFPFRDNAILQREMPVPVWGWCKPDSTVTVAFAGQKETAKAGADGKWTLKLKPACPAKRSPGKRASRLFLQFGKTPPAPRKPFPSIISALTSNLSITKIMNIKIVSTLVSLTLCGLAYSQQTVEELGDKIELAAKAKSAKELKALCFTTGEPKELTEAMSSLHSIFEKQNLQASEAKIHTTKDHTPDMKLPGEFQGKELEYLIPPTHWILIRLSSKEGEQPKMDFKLTFPAVKVGDVWRIPGIKYK